MILILFGKFLLLHIVTYAGLHDLGVIFGFVKHLYLHFDMLIDVNAFIEMIKVYFVGRTKSIYFHLALKYLFGNFYRTYYCCNDFSDCIYFDAVHKDILDPDCLTKLEGLEDKDISNIRIMRIIYTVIVINLFIGVNFYMK